MSIILMLVGVLILILFGNVLTIVSNPENISITSLLTPAIYKDEEAEDQTAKLFAFKNKSKEPSYIDVYRNRVVLYTPDPAIRGVVVSLMDMEVEGNVLEKMLARVETNKVNEYIILLARPRSAINVRKLKKVIRDRGIDVGVELFEADRDVKYDQAIKASGR
jgi:hypothetical protein